MPRYIDVSNWDEQHHYNTVGTRNKCVVQNPSNGDEYFFKTSLKKGDKDYTTEFWSEIIASELGDLLDFHVLKYDIAKRGDCVGCISKKMISVHEDLKEGISLLKSLDNTYDPEKKESKKIYTFDFAKRAIVSHELSKYIPDFIKMLVFDAMIGNSDRHQENWAFIVNGEDWRFSPIYDSGSSLGRELSESDLKKKLHDEKQFEAYISRGRPEFHNNEGKKVNHFEFLKTIHINHPQEIETPIRRIAQRYDDNLLRDKIFNIDGMLPSDLRHHGLSEHRKEFIFKLINYRIKQLIKTFAL